MSEWVLLFLGNVEIFGLSFLTVAGVFYWFYVKKKWWDNYIKFELLYCLW